MRDGINTGIRLGIMRGVLGVGLALTISACGMWQSVKDGTVNATRAVFETKVEQMTLVITARAALNQDGSGASLPVVLRIYQLKDDKPFATATYSQFLAGSDALKAATLWSRDVTLGPGQTLKVSEPIGDAANYVGVAAFFRESANAEWFVLVPKSQWKKTDPVRLVATDRTLELDTEHR
jgi:type VI secretion system protein VasD